jgi:hypothetical protein
VIHHPVSIYIDVEKSPFLDQKLSNGKAWVFHVDVTVYLYQICDEYGLHVGYISDLSDIAEI